MNIYQKLIEVRKAVPYLKKDNQGYKFKYVSSSQTLGALKQKMDDLGLLLIPGVLKQETRDHTTKEGKHEYFTILDMTYKWVDAEKPEDSICCTWTGHGLDPGEKGVGKALTYAEKYFMLKFFNIPTDKDDPDSFQKKQENSAPPLKKTSADFIPYVDKCESATGVDNWLKKNDVSIKKHLSNTEINKLKTYCDGIKDVFSTVTSKKNINI